MKGDTIMKRRILFWKAKLNTKLRYLTKGKLGVPQKYNGKPILSEKEGNAYIYHMLLEGKPFCVARFGSTELNALMHFENENCSTESMRREAISLLGNNSGFFPLEIKKGYQFAELYKDLLKEVDVMAVWYNPLEDYFIEKYGDEITCVQLRAIEPYFFCEPWTKALRNKRVLVIHPFAKTIHEQYKKRLTLFDNPNILPEFQLITIRAVQTLAGQKDDRFATWFDALNYMYQETKKHDFDVAIIGCGAYGLPLAAMLKRDGKQAIHMGGATQILFGIRGKRWDERSSFKALINDSWVRPAEDEKPKNADNVENACYW